MRSRLRKLHTGGHTYVWNADIRHVAGDCDCHRCIRLRIWGDGKTSHVLRVDLLSKSYPGLWGAACVADVVYPRPADVQAVIQYALAQGWNPTASGGSFTLSEVDTGADLELSDFLVTDRLTNPASPDPTARVKAAH